MKTQTLCICDKCGKTIEQREGFIIQGNIYVTTSDINERAGIIGNAFPETSEDGTIIAGDVKEYAYHYECLHEILMEPIEKSKNPIIR